MAGEDSISSSALFLYMEGRWYPEHKDVFEDCLPWVSAFPAGTTVFS